MGHLQTNRRLRPVSIFRAYRSGDVAGTDDAFGLGLGQRLRGGDGGVGASKALDGGTLSDAFQPSIIDREIAGLTPR